MLVGAILGASELTPLLTALGAALIGALGAGAVGWRQLTVLGKGQAEKLEAEKDEILSTASARASDAALLALEKALARYELDLRDTTIDRDRLREELQETRKRLALAEERIEHLEQLLARHDITPP